MLKLSQLTALFPTEDACKEFLKGQRWPEGVECPRCGNKKVYALKHRAWHWQCHGCAKKGYRFSVITGTIFENTKYPLRTWFTVAFMMLHSKKGMSALQIKRMVFHDQASYETVWYMCQRIRAAMDNDEFRDLMGVVEIDETYVGGKPHRHRHRPSSGGWAKKHPRAGTKTPVIGAIARKGSVVAKVIGSADARTISRFVRETISDKVSLVATDDHPAYKKLTEKGYPHESVDHSAGEYVRGNVHTQNLDSPRSTPQNRPYVDGSKPANGVGGVETRLGTTACGPPTARCGGWAVRRESKSPHAVVRRVSRPAAGARL